LLHLLVVAVLIASFLLLLVLATVASPATIGIVTDRDNTLIESPTGSLSNGADPGIFAGRTGGTTSRRGLVHFPVGDLVPAGSVIESVMVRMHMSRRQPEVLPNSLHRLLAGWGEGTSFGSMGGGNGGPATPGSATWLHRFHDTVFWTTPGGDFDPAASATVSVGDTGFIVWGSTPELVADVQAWIDDPGSNHGWLVRTNEGAALTGQRYESRESAIAGEHPLLFVTYHDPVAVAQSGRAPTARLTVADAQPFAGSVALEFSAPGAPSAELVIVDVAGRFVSRLFTGAAGEGAQRVQWNGQRDTGGDAGAGIFFAVLDAGPMRRVARLVRLR
jgi:hypothetical protein